MTGSISFCDAPLRFCKFFRHFGHYRTPSTASSAQSKKSRFELNRYLHASCSHQRGKVPVAAVNFGTRPAIVIYRTAVDRRL